jgi:hypothetical protein
MKNLMIAKIKLTVSSLGFKGNEEELWLLDGGPVTLAVLAKDKLRRFHWN